MKLMYIVICSVLQVLLVGSVNTIVQTTYGPVEGYVSGKVLIFRGIPFAAPPLGHLRFKPPQPPTPWAEAKPCFEQAHICPQLYALTPNLYIGKEDCLYLDVYVPLNAGDGPFPVMNWIYGGGYVFGDGWEFGLYEGTNFVERYGVVLVTSNYRLGALGFFSLDQLKAESDEKTTGNYALQDQQAVLGWIRDNIKSFNGIPQQVTIFGESAGGFSVCWHLVSPKSRGLFRAAIIESGSCESPQFFRDYDDARYFSESWAFSVGCNPVGDDLVACLRNKSAGEIMGALIKDKKELPFFSPSKASGFVPVMYPIMPWGPAIDGSALLDNPLNLIRQGQFNEVPVIMGTNKDEGTIFVPLMYLILQGLHIPMKEEDWNRTLFHFFQNHTTVNTIIDKYPFYQYNNSVYETAAAVLRDYFFTCVARRTLNAISSFGVNTYLYHFTYAGDWIENLFLGDYHSSELAFVFGNEWPPILHIFSEKDKEMSAAFGTYWSNFAKYLDPNTHTLASWPIFNSSTQLNIELKIPVSTEQNLQKEQCEFWDELFPYVG